MPSQAEYPLRHAVTQFHKSRTLPRVRSLVRPQYEQISHGTIAAKTIYFWRFRVSCGEENDLAPSA